MIPITCESKTIALLPIVQAALLTKLSGETPRKDFKRQRGDMVGRRFQVERRLEFRSSPLKYRETCGFII